MHLQAAAAGGMRLRGACSILQAVPAVIVAAAQTWSHQPAVCDTCAIAHPPPPAALLAPVFKPHHGVHYGGMHYGHGYHGGFKHKGFKRPKFGFKRPKFGFKRPKFGKFGGKFGKWK